jgi:site-specific DNA recombinase
VKELAERQKRQVQEDINRAIRRRAIIYCRVSTDRQEQDGESLEYQEAKCRQYAELHDMDVVLVLKEAKSGFIHYSLREQLTTARQCIRDGLADVIIVFDLRRFSRNFVHSVIIFEEIEGLGAEIVSVSENIDNSPTGKLIRSIMAWSAESEREKIVEYANRHWQDRRERVLPIGVGSAPYGWSWGDAEKTSYVINKEEAAVRLAIFHMYVELEMSLRSIATKLTSDGVPTPTMSRFPDKEHRRGRVWSRSSVYDILRAPENIGVLTLLKWHKAVSDKGTAMRIPHPEQTIIPGGIPAIIPVNVYERAQRRFAANKENLSHPPKDKTQFLVRGYVRCGSCGCRMAPHMHKRHGYTYPYYRCNNHTTKYNKCPDCPWVRADLVDALVWEDYCRVFDRLDVLQEMLEHEAASVVNRMLADQNGAAQIAGMEAAIEYAREERRKQEVGSYTYNLITHDIQVKEEQLERFKAESVSEQGIAAATALYQQRILEYLEFLNVMDGNYEHATFQQKRNALDVLGVMVTLDALPPEARHSGRDTTVAELRQRMHITYSPFLSSSSAATEEQTPAGTGVQTSLPSHQGRT